MKREKFKSYWKRLVEVLETLKGREPKSLQVRCNATTDEFEVNIVLHQKLKEKGEV